MYWNACKIMFRISNYQILPIIINLFKLQHSNYNMQDNKKFKIPLINTNANTFNITYYIPIFLIIYQYTYIHNHRIF